MGTAEKLAIGAAAAIAIGAAANALSKDDEPEAPVDTVAPPEVRTGSNGTMDVVLASGCTVTYNDIGLRQSHSGTCGDADYSAAKKAMDAHLKAQDAAAR